MSRLSAEEINEIIHRRALGQSVRGIARTMCLSRRAVSRALSEHDSARQQGSPHPGLPGRRRRRPSVVDDYEEAIGGFIKRYPDITVIRLLEELRALGYQGGYSVLRERVKALRVPAPAQPIQRFETGPGIQAQMDWATYTIEFSAEGTRRVNLFSYLLGYSRRQYLHFTERQDFETLLREHVRAFEHLGGAAATCLYDNMKTVVSNRAAMLRLCLVAGTSSLGTTQNLESGQLQLALELFCREVFSAMNHLEELAQRLAQPFSVGPITSIRQGRQELHIADQVGQAKLDRHVEPIHEAPIGRKVVAAQDSVELCAQHLDQHIRTFASGRS